MKVPFVDLKIQYQELQQEIESIISDVFSSSHFLRGVQVQEFEESFAKLHLVKHAISVSSGTDALFIALKAYGIGPGDEVITTACSWISTSEVISLTGATPVFIDIDEDHLIDTSLIEEKISPATKAIIPVHLFGQACNMVEINAICKKHGLFLLEDCAQAILAEHNNQLVGTIGNAGAFSFYPSKNLGSYSDCGCIITNDDSLAEQIRRFSNHGALNKHDHRIEGTNSRMDEIQAGVLNIKLKYIDKWTNRRIEISNFYKQQLKNLKQIKLPNSKQGNKHVNHLFVIECSDREALLSFLSTNGIDTSIHYPVPLPFLECYSKFDFKEEDFPISLKKSKQILSLPMYPELTNEQINYVCDMIKQFYLM